MSSAAGARESGEGSCSYNLTAATGTTVSPPDDPWPINPNGSTVEAYNSQLWNEGFNIVITCVGARGWMGAGGCSCARDGWRADRRPPHIPARSVDRIWTYFVIIVSPSRIHPCTHRNPTSRADAPAPACAQAIVPIVINTFLALLVFSVSPRHLDTRLGIVVTLFLSLTALQVGGHPAAAACFPFSPALMLTGAPLPSHIHSSSSPRCCPPLPPWCPLSSWSSSPTLSWPALACFPSSRTRLPLTKSAASARARSSERAEERATRPARAPH